MNRTTRLTLVVLTAALLLAPRAATSAAETRQTNSGTTAAEFSTLPDSYPELYRQILAKQGGANRMTAGQRLGLSAIACRLWMLSHSAELGRQAVKFLDETLRDSKFDLADFHNMRVFGEHAWLMKQAGLLTPDLKRSIDKTLHKHLASPAFEGILRGADPSGNNITQMWLYGYAGVLKYFEGEDLPQRPRLMKRLQSHCDSLFKTGDLDEDASNYDSLGLAHFMDIVRLLGREKELKDSPGFRRLFDRMRDIVSPAGLVPEYGDSYFTYSACPLDRVYLLEYAAQLYGDATYLDAAQRLYRRPTSELPGADVWARALPLINLKRSIASPLAPSQAPSLVTCRRGCDQAEDQIDKLILRTGHQRRRRDDRGQRLCPGVALAPRERPVRGVLRGGRRAAVSQPRPPRHAVLGHRQSPLRAARIGTVPRVFQQAGRVDHHGDPRKLPLGVANPAQTR